MLGLGLLRRLLGGEAPEPKPPTAERELALDRIEAARQRLKQTIPPPASADLESDA